MNRNELYYKIYKKNVEKIIDEISIHPKRFAKNFVRDFTSTKKLSFKQNVKAIVSMSGNLSVFGEVMNFLNMDISSLI